MLLAKSLCALMKVDSHLSHKAILDVPSLNILVRQVAEYGSAMWWFMRAKEMERIHL